jgi:glycosyltransferase involved in cell wall biosynthesis
MRILMVVPKYPFPVIGGLERQAHELAKVLQDRGHSIAVLSSRFDDSQAEDELVEGIEVRRIPWSESRAARFIAMPWHIFVAMASLRRRVDVIHVHNITWFGAFVTVVAKLCRLPVIIKLPNFGAYGITHETQRLFGWLRILLLRMADCVVALTPESVQELRSIGFPLNRVLKVTNGIKLTVETRLRQKQASNSQTLNVTFVGRLSPEKGLCDLLHVWADLKGDGEMKLLRIVGDGPQASELRQLAHNLEIEHSVNFVGHSEAVETELAAADIFVLPSYGEGNSNALLEAMREGLPIVATQVGGAPLQVGTNGWPFLFQPGDRAGLRSALATLISDARLRVRLGGEMRRRVAEIFDLRLVAETYERAYFLLCSGGRNEIGMINADLFGGHGGVTLSNGVSAQAVAVVMAQGKMASAAEKR